MKKTIAKVEHRDYIPSGWIAIKFCRVDFFGDREREMNTEWERIKAVTRNKYNSIYEENSLKIQMLKNEAKSILKSVDESKPFYRFWYNKKEKDMIAEADNIWAQARALDKNNEEIKEKKEVNYDMLKSFLKKKGFVITSIAYEGTECVTISEIWTLEE